MPRPLSSSTENPVLLLHKLICQGLSSIEIIPGGLKDWISTDVPNPPRTDFPFLLVEGNLGIPKKVLQDLYLNSINFPRVKSWTSATVSDKPSSATNFTQETNLAFDILSKTAIILIMNPAHQTALNVRKKLMQQGKHDYLTELRFTELLVRGIKTCAKESVLWDHRRWCMRQTSGKLGPNCHKEGSIFDHLSSTVENTPNLPAPLDIHSLHNLSPSDIRNEFDTIRQACSIYPRNYHAWTHWHYIFDVCCAQCLSRPCANGIDGQEFSLLITDEYAHMHRWIDEHVSDFSAMHQLAGARKWINHLPATGYLVSGPAEGIDDFSSLIDHTWSNLASYSSHESLWMFMRILLGQMHEKDRKSLLGNVEKLETSNKEFQRQLVLWFADRN